MGNTCVLVPSETCPLAATDFYQVLDTSDLPGGVVNIVTGAHAELAKPLAGHMDVDAVWSLLLDAAFGADREGSGRQPETHLGQPRPRPRLVRDRRRGPRLPARRRPRSRPSGCPTANSLSSVLKYPRRRPLPEVSEPPAGIFENRKSRWYQARPALGESINGSIPMVRSALIHLLSSSGENTRSAAAVAVSQSLRRISDSSCPGPQPA